MQTEDSDLISLHAFAVSRAKRFYKLLIVLLGFFAILVISYAHVAKPVYVTIAALTPPKDALLNSTGLSGASPSIASIGRRLGLGVGVGGGGSGDDYELFDEYTRVLQSYRLAGGLANNPTFLALAFPREFDRRTGHLGKPAGLIASAAVVAKMFLGLSLVRNSDTDQVYKYLTTNLTISSPHDPTTNITEITLRSDDGVAAQGLLEIILAQADSLMRDDKRRDIAARIAYLESQLQKVTLEEQKAALISLLTVQQSTMMIIAADHRYASYVVEPPHAPLKPTWPNFGGVIGLILFLAVISWAFAISTFPEPWLARFARKSPAMARLDKTSGEQPI